MAKPHTTRTYGPIHFEDLDPKRFEDLIRQLVYDFKDWNTIEATGRGGTDDGFDIRAYEKSFEPAETEDDSIEATVHPMDGRVWMIQCKREQDIGPTRIANIIKETVNPSDPPFGYILAASANISKKAHDAFRAALLEAGVMEFYLWGKAALEDFLYQPKNDRILFTFFGISFASRRRSKTTEIRSAINIKNKLATILGNNSRVYQQIMIRDLKDEYYPYEMEYSDFKQHPRWLTLNAEEQHPRGIIFKVKEYYAYIDQTNKEYDFWPILNLAEPEPNDDEGYQKRYAFRSKVIERYNTLPERRRGYYVIYGIVYYNQIALVDSKGDQWHQIPHIFVDFPNDLPFKKLHPVGQSYGDDISLEDYRKIDLFPAEPKPLPVNDLLSEPIALDENLCVRLLQNHHLTLFATDNHLAYLRQFDRLLVKGTISGKAVEAEARVNCVYEISAKDYLKENEHNNQAKSHLKDQLGELHKSNQKIFVYELELMTNKKD